MIFLCQGAWHLMSGVEVFGGNYGLLDRMSEGWVLEWGRCSAGGGLSGLRCAVVRFWSDVFSVEFSDALHIAPSSLCLQRS